ncbi:translocation/assembly module TamB domain-containing protein [Coprobacter secundus]|uniref:translocation/assembly module TamB domain-containing protein n=1 Tax=Coprobacter secundus TaxID=1501392 RepID=UPI00351FBC62
MKTLYKIFKYITIGLVVSICILYSGLYLALSIPSVQQKVREIGTAELSARLHVPVSIGEVNIYPFDKIALHDVFLPDQKGDTLLFADKLMVGIELSSLLDRKLVFTTAHLLDFDIHISKDTPESKTNFQFIIDAFKPQEKKEKHPFDVQINTVVIRRGNVSYNLLSEPYKQSGFDKNHIILKNVLSTISLKSLRRDSININVRRLSFEEKSGFSLPKLSFKLAANQKEAYFSQFKLQLQQSLIALNTAHVDLSTVQNYTQFCDSSNIRLVINHSRLVLSDLAPFLPILQKFDTPTDFTCHVQGVINHLQLSSLQLNYGKGNIIVEGEGTLDGITQLQDAFLFGKVNKLRATPDGIVSLIQNLSSIEKPISPIFTRLGTVNFQGEISGFLSNLVMFGNLSGNPGKVHADLMFSRNIEKKSLTYQGNIEAIDFDLHQLFSENNLFGTASLKFNVDGTHYINGYPTGKLFGEITHIDYNGYSYKNIELNGNYKGPRFEGTAKIDDENGHLMMQGLIDLIKEKPEFKFTAIGTNIRPEALKLTKKYKDADLSFNIHANFIGNTPDNAEGELSIDSITFIKGNERFFLKRFLVTAHNEQVPQSLKIHSDILNGEISGQYSFRTLKNSITEIISSVLPSIVTPPKKKLKAENIFSYTFKIEPTESVSKIFELPITLSSGGEIEGFYNDKESRFRFESSFPILQIRKSKLDNTLILSEKSNGTITFSARASNTNKKNKTLIWSLNADAKHDNLNARINWSNSGESTFCGELSTTTHFSKSETEKLPIMDIKINPSNLILNDSIWKIQPATVLVDSGRINISSFEIRHGKQYLHIDGIASKLPDDEINLQLNDLNLDYIFESLNIRHVTFGGQATGNILVSNLMSGAPRLSTKKFDVKDFTYNDAYLGNLNLYSQWINENQGILLKGKISQQGHPDTGIYGHIFPTRDSLHLSFDAHYLNLDFIQPFIGNILTGFTGRATGKIDFYGKFNALNVSGNAFAQNVKFGVDYLNTTYSLTDSVHLTPNSIWFDNVTVTDKFGHTARAKGMLKHNHFKNLTYDIGISEIRNLLVFDVTEQLNPVYYGTIFGTGTASIIGDMDKTDIDVNMRTDAKSKFTFVLTGNETANDYQFITFVNKTEELRKEELRDSTNLSLIDNIKRIEETTGAHTTNVNLQIDATPDATMQIVMDPATGDIIKANGAGGIRIEYNTFSDMKIYGTYTLEKGSYSFSLQDLITKVFNIKSGSQISFRGNPLEADLNIDAIYSLTANLTDLSESFAEEKELSRTTVPVNTVLSVSGNLQHPDLKFDIAFPTLTQDIDRQVRSIISTEEMMNRQIIYLLALGKFYTPDYMNVGQARNNELASVASSTLSSQLSNMLGQISDKWNIGTNIRSDKGDFSDVEVELALSSQLLNNRLIFNGNFGYRDNQVNSNAFVGDFDLEYLLNKSGSLRLKAYNHYNDRNYYIKSALTTQGVGIMFKRDFGRFTELFNRIHNNVIKRRKKRENKNLENSLTPVLSQPTNSGKK